MSENQVQEEFENAARAMIKTSAFLTEDSLRIKKAKEILTILSGMKYSEVCEALESARLIAANRATLS